MKKFIKITFSVLLIVTLCLSLTACGKNTPKGIADAYMTACYKEFSSTKVGELLNEDVVLAQTEGMNTDFETQLQSLQVILSGQRDQMIQSGTTVSWEFIEERELEGEELEKFVAHYKEHYKLDLTAVTEITVESTKKEKDKEPQTSEFKLYVMEVDEKLSIDIYTAQAIQ